MLAHFLRYLFFYCRRHISHCHTRVAFSFPLRRVSPQSLQFFCRVIVQCGFRCFSVFSFDYLEHVGSADSLMGARCSSTKNQFVRKLCGILTTSNHMSRRRQQIRDISDDGRLNIVESFCFVHRNFFSWRW